jgi:hypothetical protein
VEVHIISKSTSNNDWKLKSADYDTVDTVAVSLGAAVGIGLIILTIILLIPCKCRGLVDLTRSRSRRLMLRMTGSWLVYFDEQRDQAPDAGDVELGQL